MCLACLIIKLTILQTETEINSLVMGCDLTKNIQGNNLTRLTASNTVLILTTYTALNLC